MGRVLPLILAVAMLLSGCGDDAESASAPNPGAPRTIEVTSPAFRDGQPIPSTYTCDGKGISPPLQWSGVRGDEIGSLALVVDDPDAPGGGYVHWVVLGIPAGHGQLEAGSLPDGAKELEGSGGRGWKPPCPPAGRHHYRFTVYAFPSNASFAVSGDRPLSGVLAAMADQAVAWGRLTGTVTASGGGSGGGY